MTREEVVAKMIEYAAIAFEKDASAITEDTNIAEELGERFLTEGSPAFGPEVRKTAGCFIDNNLNIAETSRQLHIHRNTLLYRLEQIQNETGSAWGYFATKMLESFNLDLGFFGASCIDEKLMITTPTTDKAFLKREAVKRCAKSVLAVDAGKFGNKAVIAVNRVQDYNILVTDRDLTDGERESLAAGGTEVIKV